MPLINGQIGQIWENCHFICQKVHYFWSYWLNKCKIDINFNIFPKNIPIILKPGLPLLLLKGVSELKLSFSSLGPLDNFFYNNVPFSIHGKRCTVKKLRDKLRRKFPEIRGQNKEQPQI